MTKARAGALKQVTGIDSPYEAPEKADIELKTAEISPDAALALLLEKALTVSHPDHVADLAARSRGAWLRHGRSPASVRGGSTSDEG